MQKNDQNLLQKIEALESRLNQALKENASLKQENKLLREKVDLLVRRSFSSKSESILHPEFNLEIKTSSQLVELADTPSPKARKESPEVKVRKKRVLADLPTQVQVIDPEPVLANPDAYRCIGEEVSEAYDYQPGRFFKNQIIRRKYVSKTQKQKAPVIAPLPPLLQERCHAAPGLIAAVIVGKYVDHLPLYRQEQIFLSRHGVEISRQSLCHWIGLAADWLKPLYRILSNEIFENGYVQCDETPIRYLLPGNGTTKTGYLWVVRDPRPGGEALYRWDPSRSSKVLEELIPPEVKILMQCDGFSAYESYAQKHPDFIELAACWAHVRRKFFEAQEHELKKAKRILRLIKLLYAYERSWKDLTSEQRLEKRIEFSKPWIERFWKILTTWTLQKKFLPKSSMGRAIQYAFSLRARLEVFLSDGRVQIDNNLVENSVRPTAIGKKNWLFFGGEEAGERSAILFTLVESCKRHQINPLDYFKHVLTEIPKYTNHTVHSLTPRAYAQSIRTPKALAA